MSPLRSPKGMQTTRPPAIALLCPRSGNKPQATERLTSPVDYRNGTVHIRTEVLDRPVSGESLAMEPLLHSQSRPGQRLRMHGTTHPGVGHVTALATEVFLGDPTRFADGKALASYVGMIPSEYSSGPRQRLGGLSKQGNPLLRFLWGEAAMHAVRRDPELQRFYRRKLQQKGLGKARVAAARKLGIRLWIMLRDRIDYAEFCRRSPRRQS